MMVKLSQFSGNQQTIPNGKQYSFNPWVLLQFFGILFQGNGLLVQFGIGLKNLAAPKHVIRNDVSARIQLVKNKVEVVGIVLLIGINKNEVERLVERWNDL